VTAALPLELLTEQAARARAEERTSEHLGDARITASRFELGHQS
jgi:hypothetical protein